MHRSKSLHPRTVSFKQGLDPSFTPLLASSSSDRLSTIMSLFAGTSFLAGANDKPIEEIQVAPPPPAYPTETGTSLIQPLSTLLIHTLESAEQPEPVTASKPVEPTNTTKPPGTGQAAWSAALRFAPAAASRRSKPVPQKPTASFVAARIATTSTSFSAAPAIVGPATVSTASAAVVGGTTDSPIDVDVPPDAGGKKIFRPPAMTLDQGEAFAASAGRKRGAPGQGGGKKKKWRKVGPPRSFWFWAWVLSPV